MPAQLDFVRIAQDGSLERRYAILDAASSDTDESAASEKTRVVRSTSNRIINKLQGFGKSTLIVRYDGTKMKNTNILGRKLPRPVKRRGCAARIATRARFHYGHQ
jgi:hypothetical protein